MSLHYFAFGSNMLTERLQARVPSAQAVGTARLPGYALRFHKRSTDGSGKCSVVPSPQTNGQGRSAVYGVRFVMDGGHLPSLDAAEARGDGYRREMFDVRQSGYTESVFAYVAQPDYVDPDLRPYRWYKALVLAGALQHDLPDAYVDHIRNVEAVRDPDEERRQENEALLRDAGFGSLTRVQD
jgi:hypothetical protein